MEKFHHFLYATKFVLETDQKPLETILAKSLNAATPQLQRILIKIFAYDFTVKYLPGENNQLADCLSRLGCLHHNTWMAPDSLRTSNRAPSLLDLQKRNDC